MAMPDYSAVSRVRFLVPIKVTIDVIRQTILKFKIYSKERGENRSLPCWDHSLISGLSVDKCNPCVLRGLTGGSCSAGKSYRGFKIFAVSNSVKAHD